jgi:hypothetical protein
VATKLKQVSVVIENRPGTLKGVLKALTEAGVDIRALSIADANGMGIARMVLSDTEQGLAVLAAAGYEASTSEVLRVVVPDQPGGLYKAVAEPLAEENINIEYLYAFVDQPQEAALVVLDTSDVERAANAINRKAISEQHWFGLQAYLKALQHKKE